MTVLANNSLFITGIVVHFEEPTRISKGGWRASLQWQDAKFDEKGSVQGEISTQSQENSISAAIDSVLSIAKHFNVHNNEDLNIPIGLYYKGDGKDKHFPPFNSDWFYTKDLLLKEATKRGWQTY